jgi:thiamine-phosphate pyrophosphorylase
LLLYYITDRAQLGGNEADRTSRLLDRIREAAEAEVDYIQLREKDLPVRELESLAREAVRIVRRSSTVVNRTRLLVNSRIDVAIAAGADGVHLRSSDLSASDARAILLSGGIEHPIVAASCHSLAEAAAAEAQGADFAVYGPVFGKGDHPGVGAASLRAVCNRVPAADPRMPVLALGGLTLSNADECLRAGAAGIAAIRLFQDSSMSDIVSQLRRLAPEAPGLRPPFNSR